ncbi:MAG TPA: hypothetical protein VEV45_24725 [Streptosporangiaceae bacterium]|nr:hypothetical protein [Streptosporangiaceae bacterium]
MPRTVRYWLAAAASVTALALTGWPGPAHNPATLISRVSVIAAAALMAGLPWLIRRWYGAPAAGWFPAIVRVAGFGVVVALLAVKTRVEHVEFAAAAGHRSLAGLWTGEVIFLAVIAAYVAGLLIATASRGPASRTTLVIGTCSGVGIGIAVYGLRPLAGELHVANAALAVLYEIAKVLAVPVVLAVVLAAAMAAARRASRRKGGRTTRDMPARAVPARDMPARQGLAAGACVGFTAALVVSLLGIVTIALVPHLAMGLQWTLPGRGVPQHSMYDFEVALTEAGAGYLLVLLIFPILGAGLGAWAGLFSADGGLRPDGGGGGGGPGKGGPKPAPSGGGGRAAAPPELARADLARLLALADWRIIAGPAGQPTAPEPERVPAGVPSYPR